MATIYPHMLKNYFKVALRNLWKNKGYTVINIIGLAAGLGVCLLIVLYVVDETSYDKYNVKADRIYRLDADIRFNNTQFSSITSPKPLARTLAKEYPDVERMVRLTYQGDVQVKKGNDHIQDHHLVFADSTFFQVFTDPMLSGDPLTALNEPKSIVIDETTARRYFNNTDIVGRTLEIDNGIVCKVTGVMKDMPRQSHFHFSFIRPMRDAFNGDENDWLSNNAVCYILAKPGAARDVLQGHIDAIVDNYLAKDLLNQLHSSLNDLKGQGSYFRYHLMPLPDIHLHSNKSY